ncbi:hypothetical protein [Dyadobacter koreensis]|uniref:hypothetical protein n=1 Tax=Dyadobacter koreensis TaxID=408657 RepID=UPI00269D2B5C
MFFPVEKSQTFSLCYFMNRLLNKTCFIVTAIKMKTESGKILDDEVFETVSLNRLLYRCHLRNLIGKVINRRRATLFLTTRLTSVYSPKW